MGAFAWVTLSLQAGRRRRLPDVTLWYWRLAMLSLLLGVALWTGAGLIPALGETVDIALGVLMIIGVAVSVICGMLYKIVPFLVWLHLQDWRPAPVLSGVPNMKVILPQHRARVQFLFHVGALGLLLGAALQPGWLIYPAALAFGASCAALELNLLSALRVYRRVRSTAA